MLLIDVSGSMNLIGKLEAARSAAAGYVHQMRPGDRAGVIAFNTRVTPAHAPTEDRAALLDAIAGLEASDDTALYDGLAAAVDSLSAVSGRKAILVLSDGMDNSSRLSAAEVLARIGPGGMSISTIGLGDPTRAEGAWAGLDESTLRALAADAGGRYGFVDDAAALTEMYERLGRALQSEFVLTYLSPASLRDGVNRSLSVGLAQAPTAAQAHYNLAAWCRRWPTSLLGRCSLRPWPAWSCW